MSTASAGNSGRSQGGLAKLNALIAGSVVVAAGIAAGALPAQGVSPPPAPGSEVTSASVANIPAGVSAWKGPTWNGYGSYLIIRRLGSRVHYVTSYRYDNNCWTGRISGNRLVGYSRWMTGPGPQNNWNQRNPYIFSVVGAAARYKEYQDVGEVWDYRRLQANSPASKRIISRLTATLRGCLATAARGGVFDAPTATAERIYRGTFGYWPWQPSFQQYPLGAKLAISNPNYGWLWANSFSGNFYLRPVAAWQWKPTYPLFGYEGDGSGPSCRPSSMRKARIPASVQRDYIAAGVCKPNG